MTMRVGYVSIVCFCGAFWMMRQPALIPLAPERVVEVDIEVFVAGFTNGESNPCRDGLGLGVSMYVWLPWAPACAREATSADCRGVEGTFGLATRVARGSLGKSIADSSWTSIPWFGAPPFAVLGPASGSPVLPGVSPAAITTTNKSESNRGSSVI